MDRLIEPVTVPEGRRGPWRVERFTLTEEDVALAAIRASFKGRGYTPPGTYTKLIHDRRGVVMSDTADEMRDHYSPVLKARGHVLLNGLGLGMVLGAVLRREGVESVTVVEIDADVIALVGPHYQRDPRVSIIHADAFAFKPPPKVRYGCVWHDVWDELCGDNLPSMTKLKRKYGRRADWQGCWGEYWCRRHMR